MIELYAKGTTDFTRHGIALAAKDASVVYQDNGRYDMDMTMPYNAAITIDYGMILRCPVPKQTIGAITLGNVSYWEVASGQTNVPLYKSVPVYTRVNYENWQPNEWDEGTTVTFDNKNWVCTQDLRQQAITANPFEGSPYWTQVSSTRRTGGEVIVNLNAGDRIIKTGDYNDTYMKAADTAGHEGFIQTSKCTDLSESGSRVIQAQTIEKQSFVITEITKSTDGKTLTIHAEHISYQLGRTILGDCNISRANPATAILFITGAMKQAYPGNIYTNLTQETITGDYSWKNAQNAILDPKSGLLSQTTAVMLRNDYNVFILSQGNTDARYRITYGTNMKSVKWDGNVDDLVTRIYPIAQTAGGETLLLPEEYIETVRTVPYDRPEVINTKLKVGQKEKQEDGSEITLTEDIVYARMREQANNRFNIDECDKAVITLDLDWEHLPDTEEFRAYKNLQNAAPGDWVDVLNGPLGITEKIQMTGYTFDPITERYKKGTFGKKKAGSTIAGYQLATGSVSGRAIGVGAVGGTNLQANSITAREIEANAITADRIAAKSIDTEHIHANAITADEINANAVTADKIAANSITAVKIAAEAVTADKIQAGAVTAIKIAADAITATKIAASDISAINAKLGTATITNGMIDNANISYARIMDASVGSLITKDAVADAYYIDKLQVRNAQMVYATVGELVIKAADNKYYRLDVDEYGALSPTEVTLTAAEIAAGETSDGHAAIIETDLVVGDLSANNMKAINALIDKINASRIDVGELWARQAFINQLMVTDISSNTYIQQTIGNWQSGSTITQTINSLDTRISSLGYGTIYMQPEEPNHGELVAGDIWIQTQPSGTWEQVYQDYATWEAIYNDVSTWQTLGGVPIMWAWDGRKWQKQLDELDSDTFETEIRQNSEQIVLQATQITNINTDIGNINTSLGNKYTIRSGITIEPAGIDISGSQYVKIASGGVFSVQTGNFGIDSESSTHVLWSGASSASNASFWVKKSGEIYAVSGTVGGFTLATNSLSSGSGATYININSNAANTYAIWAGATLATNAPFRLKRDGTVYLTSLIALAEDGTESTVNLRTAGLWKLNYATIKTLSVDSGGYCTSITFSGAVSGYSSVNFKSAASVTLSQSGWGAGGVNIVTASNGRTETVNPPTVNMTTGTFSNHKIPVYASVTGGQGYVGTTQVDATSEYNSGYNQAISDATQVTRYTRSAGTYGGSTTHYISDSSSPTGYRSVGNGWYQTTRADAYTLPAPKS